MNELYLVKLGGSLITNKTKPFTQRPKVISRLAKEIVEARRRKGTLLILGHGGGSYPHVPAKRYKVHKGVFGKESFKGIAKVQDAAARLNRIIVSSLIKKGENAVSLNPSSFMIAGDGEIKHGFTTPARLLLEKDMLPVVYGDVLLDTKKGCSIASTERVLSFLAKDVNKDFRLKAFVYCGITNGVLDSKKKTIPVINEDNFEKIKDNLGSSSGIDVTGGMLHKVKEGLKVAKSLKTKIFIINGKKSGNLKNILLGKKIPQATTIR